jgi:hypothetical protein
VYLPVRSHGCTHSMIGKSKPELILTDNHTLIDGVII